ncbi:uncharacterized protein [Nicotiana tomentosiformis]|uniref:uncharacterized protein n=1 Tax=Nicotiana tomentosiformis TaxID=4098 RepID=UPI00388C4DCB
MTHMFFTSYAARKVWNYFLTAAGINVDGLTFHQAIVRCWTLQTVPRLKPIIQALPSIIVWELWKRRNGYKYGDLVSFNRVIYQISTMVQSLVKFRKPSLQNIPHKWPDLITMMEQGNPERISIGYVLRNEEGNIVYACGKEIQEGTNTEAEMKAILEALKFCVNNDYILIDLHTDSMWVKNVIQGVWAIPWTVAEEVKEIKELMGRCNLQISHTLREGNQLADYIANYAIDTGPLECHSFWELDVKGRKIVNNDKLQCPYIRVKVVRD